MRAGETARQRISAAFAWLAALFGTALRGCLRMNMPPRSRRKTRLGSLTHCPAYPIRWVLEARPVTGVSWHGRMRRVRRPPQIEGASLARASLACLAISVLQSGCLVLGSPPLDDPEQTPPFFLPATATPDLREIVTIPNELVAENEKVTFSAMFVSEDAGVSVRARYFLDYGIENAAGQPYDDVETIREIEPATMADGPRRVQAEVSVAKLVKLSPGCHTLTLMISHAFDDATGCPRNLDDSSQLTWFFTICDRTGPGCDLSTCPKSSDNPASVSCEPVASEGGGS